MSLKENEAVLTVNEGPANPCEPKPSSSHRILVVDDETLTRNSFRAYLQRAGFEVEEADGGEAALERIYHFEPHIVLLDILMPGMAGNELLETIKEWKSNLEVIVVTRVEREEIRAQCFSKGAYAVLTKPVEMHVLTSTIRKALQQRSQQES